MAKKLPRGYTSWIQLYLYAVNRHPNLLKEKTFTITTFSWKAEDQLFWKISVQTLIRNTFKEIMRDAPSREEAMTCLQIIYTQSSLVRITDYEKVKQLLLKYVTLGESNRIY
jgi:hypothetical protein